MAEISISKATFLTNNFVPGRKTVSVADLIDFLRDEVANGRVSETDRLIVNVWKVQPLGGHPSFIDLHGRRSGNLVAVEYLGRLTKATSGYWYCHCLCGGDAIVKADKLTSRTITSCGCVLRHKLSRMVRTHGKTDSPEWRAWRSMLARCFADKRFRSRYWDRGIVPCARMKETFDGFHAVVGDRPSPRHSLDRWPDNDNGYWCGECEQCKANGWQRNVRWATDQEQQRNLSTNVTLTLGNETLCVHEWAERLGVSSHTLFSRIKMGWPDEDILTRPVRRKRSYPHRRRPTTL